MYYFIVRISSVDYDWSIIPDDKQPAFDGWLSVGSVREQQVSLNGKQIPVQVISYYDDINNFDFNPTKKQIQFTMPSNWNITKLEEQKQVMVHEEVSIPKGSSLASKSYIGTINGINVTKDLMVDPTNRTEDVVHFMLPKPVVIQLAEQVNKNRSASVGSMEFTLQPTDSVSTSATMSGTNM